MIDKVKAYRVTINNRGMTLVEVILALALGAAILAPLTIAFKTSLETWEENKEHSDLLYHARTAMAMMTSELRYAEFMGTGVSKLDSQTCSGWGKKNCLVFTPIRENPENYEVIEYEPGKNMFKDYLRRRILTVNSAAESLALGAPTNIAGDPSGDSGIIIRGAGLEITYYGSDLYGKLELFDLTDSSSDYSLADTVAVKIELTMDDEDGDSVTLSSLVKLRNKM